MAAAVNFLMVDQEEVKKIKSILFSSISIFIFKVNLANGLDLGKKDSNGLELKHDIKPNDIFWDQKINKMKLSPMTSQ